LPGPNETDEPSDTRLSGTTYKVYRYMLKQSAPVGVSDVQKGTGLSSPSLAQYHIKKLLQMELVREEPGGYVVDRSVLAYIVRVRRVSVPVQSAYVVFFAVTMSFLLLFLRPGGISSLYFLALVINAVALGASVYELNKVLRSV